MKTLSGALVGLLFACTAMAADIGVSVTIGQPGFYGHIEIGNYGTPKLIYRDPIIIQRPGRGVSPGRPVYLHVPPGHARNWRKHCHRYDACSRQVYFVQESWYNEVVVPKHRRHDASEPRDKSTKGGRHSNRGAGGKGRKDD